MNEVSLLTRELKKFDNKDGYKLKYETVANKLNPIINQLKEKREEALEELHALLENDETWSCLFALEIIREIKSEKSIPILINYLIKNDDSDYFESGEIAMFALNEIGSPAVELLMKANENQFNRKKFITYLVGALTEIKDKRVYSYMASKVKDYLENPEKYDSWFNIVSFTYDFDKHNNKDVIPLLRKITETRTLEEIDLREINSTIEAIEDPEAYKEKLDTEAARIKEEYFSDEDKPTKLGRNEPCWCGSEKKYKKCCLDDDIKELGRARKI